MMMASDGINALSELLTCQKKLFRVWCVRVNAAKNGVSGNENEVREHKSVYVASTSIENASLKAVQFLNQAQGVTDYEVDNVGVVAGNGSDAVFID